MDSTELVHPDDRHDEQKQTIDKEPGKKPMPCCQNKENSLSDMAGNDGGTERYSDDEITIEFQ